MSTGADHHERARATYSNPNDPEFFEFFVGFAHSAAAAFAPWPSLMDSAEASALAGCKLARPFVSVCGEATAGL